MAGYLTKKEYLRFFTMTGGPRVRWYHHLPVIGRWLFQKALRKHSLDELRKSLRERLLTNTGEFPFHPELGTPFYSMMKVDAPSAKDVLEADRKNRVIPDISITLDDV